MAGIIGIENDLQPVKNDWLHEKKLLSTFLEQLITFGE